MKPLQLATLKSAPYSGVSFSVGSNPVGVAFDGANIWVANTSSNNVTKLRASDGALQGTFSVGAVPWASPLTAPTSGWQTVAATL